MSRLALAVALALMPFGLPCPFCPIAPPNTANIVILFSKLQALETKHDLEMQWRKAEEKCANKLLQDQVTEIQEKLNTHIHICVFAQRFKAVSKAFSDDGGDEGKWAVVNSYRDTLVDNSRVEGKRVKPGDLIDLEEGKFKVPPKADGEYEFTVTISADTYQDTDEPHHRQASWAIVKGGNEQDAVDEMLEGEGSEFSIGLMRADAGGDKTADTVSLSKTVIFSLKAGDEVYVATLKNDQEDDEGNKLYPYTGEFISFCASLLEKQNTKNAFSGSDSPVLGLRAKCSPKVGLEIPEPDAVKLTTSLSAEEAEKSAAAKAKIIDQKEQQTQAKADTAKLLAEYPNAPWAKIFADDKNKANEKNANKTIENEKKQEEEDEKQKEKKQKEEEERKCKQAKSDKIAKEKEEEETIEREKQEHESHEKLEKVMDTIQEVEEDGEEKWYMKDSNGTWEGTNTTVKVYQDCCLEEDECTENELTITCRCRADDCEKKRCTKEEIDDGLGATCLHPQDFMFRKQEEMGWEHQRKAKETWEEEYDTTPTTTTTTTTTITTTSEGQTTTTTTEAPCVQNSTDTDTDTDTDN